MLPKLRHVLSNNTLLALGFVFLVAGLLIYLFDRELYWLYLGAAFTVLGVAVQLLRKRR